MTDKELTDEELVKALRDTYDLVKMWPEKRPDGFTNLLVLRNLVPDTADRLEALTKERDEQIEWVKRLADMQIASEAKLAKAVEVLLLARVHVANNEQGWSVGRASARSDLEIINATLAEIEGEKG